MEDYRRVLASDVIAKKLNGLVRICYDDESCNYVDNKSGKYVDVKGVGDPITVVIVYSHGMRNATRVKNFTKLLKHVEKYRPNAYSQEIEDANSKQTHYSIQFWKLNLDNTDWNGIINAVDSVEEPMKELSVIADF